MVGAHMIITTTDERVYNLADPVTAEEAKEHGFQSVMESRRADRKLMAVRTGEKRAPVKGEWFLSGAIPEAYQVKGAMTGDYNIMRLVTVRRVISYEVEEPRKICSGEEEHPITIEVPLSPANDPSPLREMFTVTHIPVTDPKRLVPMVAALLERFDTLPERMRPGLSAHGQWDLDNYWEPLVAQIDVLRKGLQELRVIALPTEIGGFTTLPPCSHCSGSGQDPLYLCQGITPPPDGGHRCPRCGGSGKEKEKEKT